MEKYFAFKNIVPGLINKLFSFDFRMCWQRFQAKLYSTCNATAWNRVCQMWMRQCGDCKTLTSTIKNLFAPFRLFLQIVLGYLLIPSYSAWLPSFHINFLQSHHQILILYRFIDSESRVQIQNRGEVLGSKSLQDSLWMPWRILLCVNTTCCNLSFPRNIFDFYLSVFEALCARSAIFQFFLLDNKLPSHSFKRLFWSASGGWDLLGLKCRFSVCF